MSTCIYLDQGSVENRDAFSRFWRDAVSTFVDGLPKANGTANGEEGAYPDAPYQANYIKLLLRQSGGNQIDVDPKGYCGYLKILRDARLRRSNDFKKVLLHNSAPMRRRLTNPQGGLPVSIEGPDPSGINLNLFRAPLSMRPAPRIDGQAPPGGRTLPHENTAEAVELYWMALLRDLPFRVWTTSARLPGGAPQEWQALENAGATLENALRDLNLVRQYFAETYPTDGGSITENTIFRGSTRGDRPGPYLSQFLLRGNTVLCGRNRFIRYRPAQGRIVEGSVPNLQTQITIFPFYDYLRRRDQWLSVEQGLSDPSGTDAFECEELGLRFIRNLRDLANWVHLDSPSQHFRNAALLLLNEPPLESVPLENSPPPPDQPLTRGRVPLDGLGGGTPNGNDPCRPTGRPFPFAPGNPYALPAQQNPDASNQMGFVTFGPEHVINALNDVADLALRAAWWQKWFVHRRLRPEEFGGLLNEWLNGRGDYRLDKKLSDFGELFELIRTRNNFTDASLEPHEEGEEDSYLLPQVFPEGSPTHPAYPSGHATISGACATLLKAFFRDVPMTCAENDGTDLRRLPPAFVADAEGRSLEVAPTESPLTVWGEIEKLASNISNGRNAAGVHWRSDATQGMALGEAVTTYYLYETAWSLNEKEFEFSFRRLFVDELVTISRRTDYSYGRETRYVKWRIDKLGSDGQVDAAVPSESFESLRDLARPVV